FRTGIWPEQRHVGWWLSDARSFFVGPSVSYAHAGRPMGRHDADYERAEARSGPELSDARRERSLPPTGSRLEPALGGAMIYHSRSCVKWFGAACAAILLPSI